MTKPIETDGNVVYFNPNPRGTDDFNRAVTNAASVAISSPVPSISGEWLKINKGNDFKGAPSYKGAGGKNAKNQGKTNQKPDDGGKRSGGPMDSETKTYIDAKTEATRAQNDARFADVRADIATLISKVDAAPTKQTLWSAVGVTVGVLLAAFAIAGDRFDGGVGLASLSVQQAEDAKRISAGNSERMDEIDQKLDVLIRLIGNQKQ